MIRLDPELEWRMIDSISLSSEDFYSVIPSNDSLWSFDSISHAIVFHCDSMPSTEYVLKIKTIFTREKEYPFYLGKDTSFLIGNNLGFKKAELISKDEIRQADSVEFVYTSNGCFHSYYEKSILFRGKGSKSNDYFLNTTSNTIMKDAQPLDFLIKVSPGIVDSLYLLQCESKEQYDFSIKNGFLNSSTTHHNFYLLVNNKVFQFDDNGSTWTLYDKFKMKYFE